MSDFKSEPQVKIYDCFTFFNEIDILKIRIEELKDVVDKFVLVEANKTHSGKEKNLYFQELKNEFDVYKDQIVAYTVEDIPQIDYTLPIEHQRLPSEIHQRNCIYKALQQLESNLECDDNDIILISDVDEIPRKDKIGEAIKLILENGHDYVVFVQDLYYFNFNSLVSNWWCGTVACKYKQLKQFTAHQIRLSDLPGTRCAYINSTRQFIYPYLLKGGWHFSYFGGSESVRYKIQNFSHGESDDSAVKGIAGIDYNVNRLSASSKILFEFTPDPDLDESVKEDLPDYCQKLIQKNQLLMNDLEFYKSQEYIRSVELIEVKDDEHNYGECIFADWNHPCQSIVDWKSYILKHIKEQRWGQFIKPGQIAIDIGAHIGDTAIIMGLLTGSEGMVMSFEANPSVMPILEANQCLNKEQMNIKVYNLAIMQEQGVYEFADHGNMWCNGGYTESTDHLNNDKIQKIQVKGVNLCQFLKDEFKEEYDEVVKKIGFIKIDCEGYDKEIIKSIKPLIAESKPVLYVEWFDWFGANETEDLFSAIENIGYCCYDPKSLEKADRGNKIPDLLCLPIQNISTPKDDDLQIEDQIAMTTETENLLNIELISVHVPKTAGSQFLEVLKQVYHSDEVTLDYLGNGVVPLTSMSHKTKVIHGHFTIDKYNRYFPEAKRIIWLRYPIFQVVSMYFMLKYSRLPKANRYNNIVRDDNLSLIEYAEIESSRNSVSKYYANGLNLSDFYFVGIHEFSQEDLLDLKTMLQWPEVTIRIFGANTNRHYKKYFYELLSNQEIMNQLAQLNQEDMDLYREGLNLRAKRRNAIDAIHQTLIGWQTSNFVVQQELEDLVSMGYKKLHDQKGWNYPQNQYIFTQDWFSGNIPIWQDFLKPFINQSGVKALEVGSWEGMSTCWLLDNVLTDPSAHITCIDTFEGSQENMIYSYNYIASVESRFDNNVENSGSGEKVKKIIGHSKNVLPSLRANNYDFIYIDGSHFVIDALTDAVLCWSLLKVGGLIIFDDYGFGSPAQPETRTGIGIDAFLSAFSTHIEVLHKGWQVIVKKIRS